MEDFHLIEKLQQVRLNYPVFLHHFSTLYLGKRRAHHFANHVKDTLFLRRHGMCGYLFRALVCLCIPLSLRDGGAQALPMWPHKWASSNQSSVC